MNATGHWFAAIPPVDLDVDCHGAIHQVSWRRGKVVLRDHKLDEEKVFVALGGAPPPCFALLQSWRDGRGWAAASRPHPPGFIRRVAPPPVPEPLATIRRLGVVRAWERTWRTRGDSEAADDLYRLLRKHALPRLATALDVARRDRHGGRAQFVEVRLAKGTARIEGRIDETRSWVVAALPPAWLYTVGVTEGREGASFEAAPGRFVVWKESAAGIWEPALAQRS